MQNKSTYNFGFRSPLFHEARCVFQRAAPETAAQKAARLGQDRAIDLVDALRNLRASATTSVDIPGDADAKKFLDANPFKHALVAAMPGHDFTGMAFDSLEDKPDEGVLIFKYTRAGVAEELKIDGLAYIGLMWGRIEPELKAHMKVSHVVMTKLAEKKDPGFLGLLQLIARDPVRFAASPYFTTQLETAKEAAKAAAGTAGRRTSARMESERARDDLKNTTDQKLAEVLRLGRRNSKHKLSSNLGYWKMSIMGRSEEIDPRRWSFTSDAGIAKIKGDWEKLGIHETESDDYFDKLFMVLKRSYNPTFLNKKGLTKERKYVYANPIDSEGRINPKLATLTDPAFEQAVRYFKEISDVGVQHDDKRENALKLHHKYGQEPATAMLGGAIRDNAVKFRDAIRDGDWTTAGAYVLGLWAIYKAYDGMEGKDKFSKWAFRGAALYAAHIFAKNAGFNVLKKAGIQDVDEELKGTSLSAMYDILPEMKNVNSDIVVRTSMTNMGDLYRNYLKTNGAKKHRFVDPAAFRMEFADEPGFARLHPEDVYDKKNLRGVKRKYLQTGKQLYLLVEALEAAYNNTMRPHAEMSYKSFGEAVLGDPVYSKSTILDFTIALRNYRSSFRQDKSKVLGVGRAAKLQTRLSKVFQMKNMGAKVEHAEAEPGVFYGFIMGFPVAFLRDETAEGFHVVPKHIYKESGGNFNVVGDRLAFIPFKGDASVAVQDIKHNLTNKMKDRLDVFMKDNRQTGVNLGEVRWKDSVGRWTAVMTYKRMRLIPDAKAQAVPVFITPGATGKGLQIESSIDNEILVYIGNLDDTEGVRNSLILSHLVNQSANVHGGLDFKPLKWFYMAGKLQIIDNNPMDNIFQIKIGEAMGGEFIEVVFDSGHGGFYRFNDPSVEGKLMKDHDFQMGLSEAMGAKRFDAILDSFRESIKSTDEDYIINLFKAIPGWFTNATLQKWFHGLKGNHFRGSMVKGYAYALLDSQKEAIMAKFRLKIGDATSFTEVVAAEARFIVPGIIKMKRARDNFDVMKQKQIPKGEKFTTNSFQYKVMRQLMELGLTSTNYKEWYRHFVNNVFSKLGPDTKGNSEKAARLIRVLAHYTAVIDVKDIDGADTRFRVTILDKMHIETIIKADKAAGGRANVTEINGAVTAAGTANSLLTVADVDRLRKLVPKFVKRQKYERAAMYFRHVAGRILTKMDSYDVPPDPGYDAWDIDDFSWENKNYVVAGGYELVDTTPRMKMGSDYITFDKWVSKTPAERTAAGWQRANVILPRHKPRRTPGSEISFRLVRADDKKLFRELTRKMLSPNPFMTELEEKLREALMERVKRVKERLSAKWSGKVISTPAFDQMVEEQFKVFLSFKMQVKTVRNARVFDIMWLEAPEGSTSGVASELSLMAKSIEAQLAGSNSLTGTTQQNLIDQMVDQFFLDNVVSKAKLKHYFKPSTGAWSSVKGFFNDIWLLITG